jgi:hypothetical protein
MLDCGDSHSGQRDAFDAIPVRVRQLVEVRDVPLEAIASGRLAVRVAKCARKRRLTRITSPMGHAIDRQLSFEQVDCRSMQAQAAYGVVESLTQQPAVDPVKVIRRQVSHLGDRFEIQILIQVLGHVVDNAPYTSLVPIATSHAAQRYSIGFDLGCSLRALGRRARALGTRGWSRLPSSSHTSRAGRPKQATEGWTFHVAGRGADRGVAQPIAHGGQLPDFPVDFLRLGRQQPTVYPRPTVGREHERNLIEGESGAAPKRDQREPLEHAAIE